VRTHSHQVGVGVLLTPLPGAPVLFTHIRVRISNCYLLRSVMVDGSGWRSGHSAGLLFLRFPCLARSIVWSVCIIV
jgi:hypothetical protein